LLTSQAVLLQNERRQNTSLETGNQREQRQRHLWKYHTTTRGAEMGPELNLTDPLDPTTKITTHIYNSCLNGRQCLDVQDTKLSMIIIIIITFIVHINITVPR